jgi:hypothetical protein
MTDNQITDLEISLGSARITLERILDELLEAHRAKPYSLNLRSERDRLDDLEAAIATVSEVEHGLHDLPDPDDSNDNPDDPNPNPPQGDGGTRAPNDGQSEHKGMESWQLIGPTKKQKK